ncbi:MAG TPA: hypothetical protein VGL46_20560 [Pseudonocardiaceae bacterium]
MNLTAVLVTGLFAGGVSCAAVQGGLLTGLITRQRTATASHPAPSRAATAEPTAVRPAPVRQVPFRPRRDSAGVLSSVMTWPHRHVRAAALGLA